MARPSRQHDPFSSTRALFALVLASLIWLTPSAARGEQKRLPQDYGAPKDQSPDQTLLWGPRVLLFPLWLTSEYALRRPMGALITVAEREQWPEEILDFFTFGERRQL